MNRKTQMSPEYVNQASLGREFGVSSHKIGKWLEAVNLRHLGEPTDEAIAKGYVKWVPVSWAPHHFHWTWHREKTLAALRRAGYGKGGQR